MKYMNAMSKEFNLATKEELKEKVEHLLKGLTNELTEDIENTYNKANERLLNQQVLINTLQARIDKAIKFIKTHDLYHPTNEVILLNILKGSDSNESN